MWWEWIPAFAGMTNEGCEDDVSGKGVTYQGKGMTYQGTRVTWKETGDPHKSRHSRSPLCHSRESGNPENCSDAMDPCFREDDDLGIGMRSSQGQGNMRSGERGCGWLAGAFPGFYQFFELLADMRGNQLADRPEQDISSNQDKQHPDRIHGDQGKDQHHQSKGG